MITKLFLDTKLNKQLQMLSRSDKKAALAVKQARNIIDRLKGGEISFMEAGTMTKHGEQRIRGCIKYDLGGGYRLVILKQVGALYILYAGSHDDCHRWIENNRELSIDDIRQRSRCIAVDNLRKAVPCGIGEADESDGEEDNERLDNLDDCQLRVIFSGLIHSASN